MIMNVGSSGLRGQISFRVSSSFETDRGAGASDPPCSIGLAFKESSSRSFRCSCRFIEFHLFLMSLSVRFCRMIAMDFHLPMPCEKLHHEFGRKGLVTCTYLGPNTSYISFSNSFSSFDQSPFLIPGRR